MKSPPRKAPGELASKAGRKLTARVEYGALALLATVFGAPFWFFEQRRGHLADLLKNEEADR